MTTTSVAHVTTVTSRIASYIKMRHLGALPDGDLAAAALGLREPVAVALLGQVPWWQFDVRWDSDLEPLDTTLTLSLSLAVPEEPEKGFRIRPVDALEAVSAARDALAEHADGCGHRHTPPTLNVTVPLVQLQDDMIIRSEAVFWAGGAASLAAERGVLNYSAAYDMGGRMYEDEDAQDGYVTIFSIF